jgi:glycosyltransferase involved in cell wall biosynthesis
VLVVAGSGDDVYVRGLRAHAEKLGISSDVLWTGFLDRSAKAAALADADVFVVPSQSESFGLAAVEALSVGLPTVMTEGVGIASEVARNGAGVVVPPTAPAIADAIERILIDAELACSLSVCAIALVRSRYRADAVAAQVMKLYAEIGCRS